MPNRADMPVDPESALENPVLADDPRRLAEELRQSRELLALAEKSAGIGIWDYDVATGLVRGTPTFFRIHGLPVSAEPVPQSLPRSVRHPDDRARVEQGYLDEVARGGDTYETEYRVIHPDGKVRWIFGRGLTVRDAAGRPIRYSGVDIDITERKKAEEHVRLLMHEVNHRANNLLAVVQAIARQTAVESDPESFVDRLTERIAALAASNALLVSGRWEGADMAALITSQLSHFAGLVGTRVILDGPPVRLKPSAAQAVGMALHELATNAGKYGALSTSLGRVRVEWRITDEGAGRRFHLAWKESGGPLAPATPSRTGFGHTVMVRMIEEAMNGKAMLEFAADGVRWSLSCPASPALDPESR